MDVNTSMCEFRELKQQSFDDACCAFAITENMEEIAKQCGMTGGTLRSKLNPEQAHKLTPVDLVMITKASGNYNILNAVLNGLDIVTAPISKTGENQSLTERALRNAVNSGELSKLALELGGKQNLSRTDRQSLTQRAQESISNLVMLMSDLENRATPMSPMLSMGIDFLASGAPIPGLS